MTAKKEQNPKVGATRKQRKEYNIFIEIEEYDPVTDQYREVEPDALGPIGPFVREEQALAFADALHVTGTSRRAHGR
jgi:hypothetical protein